MRWSNSDVSMIIIICVILSFVAGVLIENYYNNITVEARNAITNCEAKLPRHLHCEHVITARVVLE